ARAHREPRRTQPVTRRGATALVRSLPVYSGPGERSQCVDRGRVLERAKVAEVVLAEVRAADDAAKYFAVARPGQLRHEANSLGPQWPAKYFSDLVLYRPRELGRRRVQRSRDHEDDDGLALYLMGHADRRRFRDRGMRDRGRFDLRGTDALARDLEGVVAASLDVPVTLVVDAGPIAVDPGVRQPRPVRLEVAALLGRRIAPETARHARPGLANDELAHGAAHRTAPVVHDVRVHPGARPAERAGLDRRPGGAADDAARDLRPTGVVDDRAARITDISEVPPPRVRVPRLAGRSEDEDRRPVLRPDGILTGSHQPADRGRGHAEMRHAVTLDEGPHSRRVGEIRCPVVQDDCRAEHEPARDEPRTDHPAGIGRPEDHVALLVVEAVQER